MRASSGKEVSDNMEWKWEAYFVNLKTRLCWNKNIFHSKIFDIFVKCGEYVGTKMMSEKPRKVNVYKNEWKEEEEEKIWIIFENASEIRPSVIRFLILLLFWMAAGGNFFIRQLGVWNILGPYVTIVILFFSFGWFERRGGAEQRREMNALSIHSSFCVQAPLHCLRWPGRSEKRKITTGVVGGVTKHSCVEPTHQISTASGNEAGRWQERAWEIGGRQRICFALLPRADLHFRNRIFSEFFL